MNIRRFRARCRQTLYPMEEQTEDWPELRYLGFGLRLRQEYLTLLLQTAQPVDWFEIISESYLDENHERLAQLDRVRADYPLVMHSISLGLGSPWPLDWRYLHRLKALADRLQPAWISDHLSWSGVDDVQGRLLPLPYSEETLENLVPRVREVQEFLGRQILLENVPAERAACTTGLPEAEFLREVSERSDSLILLDIANLHSTSVNQAIDPLLYLDQLPENRVKQVHLAGATALCGRKAVVDGTEPDPVWQLYSRALQRFGPISTMVERTDKIPALEEMVKELEKARCAVRTLLSID